MSKQYDLVVLGTGTAANTAAAQVRAAGRTVAVIDFRPFGGTCALRGCDPKKLLIAGASAIDHVRRMRGKGVAGDVRIDWRDLMGFKRSFTDPVPANTEQRYADKGIDSYRGQARFIGRNTVQVGGETLEARHILIAAGAEPVKMHIRGEEHLVTHEGFLDLETLPRRIVLVGGGYIAAEFSHIAARAGAEVTILQRGERMLQGFDPDVVGWLMEAFESIGVDVRLGSQVESIDKTDSGYRVGASSDGQSSVVEADVVVHAAGRAPALHGLDLEAADVAVDNGRLKLNEYLQSVSNQAVYAAGDAAQAGPPLTPVSSHDAKVAAENIIEGNRRKPDYRGVPSVAFTIPPIAMVGLSEAEAREQGLGFKVNSQKASDWFTARQAAEPTYGFKVLVEEDSERILGAHLVGPHADEVINLFALAIRHDLTASAIKGTLFAYPTGASDIGYMV
ncbi:MAG: NAD(P)/FAD-dependent oxidoreductase [Methylibium sp.]|uniref:dihydrolipoyl dehydrogenase family protein n=1 Tax=Methylibium sp. TaxID=2067992 RepID=UPI0017E2877C|nr:NAD(P)/FAD-dependent oxidoreductase [Methylibium sp.]MBA3597937.1 NAD(P)/FAD-dependent oxidoreductase [Methylibium sp.]